MNELHSLKLEVEQLKLRINKLEENSFHIPLCEDNWIDSKFQYSDATIQEAMDFIKKDVDNL